MSASSIGSSAQGHYEIFANFSSRWYEKFISPLPSSFPSGAAVMELASRVKYLMAGTLVFILLVVYRYISSEILVKGIVSEARAIDTELYDDFMMNLPAIKGKLGKKFKETVCHFYQTIQPHQADARVKEAFKIVCAAEKNFDALNKLKGAIFFRTGGSAGKIDKSGTIQLPQDGNCLFHALGYGLTLLESELRSHQKRHDFPVDHVSIRAEVTAWMRAHVKEDLQLAKEIDNAIIEWCPLLDQQQASERKTIDAEKQRPEEVGHKKLDFGQLESAHQERAKLIKILKEVTAEKPGTLEIRKLYIEMTAEEGAFASGPHMYAFCKLNPDIGIRISRKVHFEARDQLPAREVISNDFNLPFNERAQFFINPVFNLAADHFDLCVETIPKS
jgi:hypothetical protein